MGSWYISCALGPARRWPRSIKSLFLRNNNYWILSQIIGRQHFIKSNSQTTHLRIWPVYSHITRAVGLSRLCSATFEQLLAFRATFCSSSNLEQVLPCRATFEKNIGLQHIPSMKKVNNFTENFNSCEFIKCLSAFWTNDLSLNNVSQAYCVPY